MKRFAREDQKVFFTSDHHFDHANIIKYCDRPYETVEEMNADMVNKWNGVVGEDDVVFHLGDFTLHSRKHAETFFGQLNGQIFILSNPWHHDKRWLGKQEYLSRQGYTVSELPSMVVLENSYDRGIAPCIVLCHYPMYEWDRSHYGSIHLFGHSHSINRVPKQRTLFKGAPPVNISYNVGVDLNNFTPVLNGTWHRKQ
jgi:calcineurin-like phosphoesterase family protein